MNRKGQALIEFAGLLPVIFILTVGALSLIRAEWNRMRCSQIAFLAAHHARIGLAQAMGGGIARVEKISGGFRATAQCGSVRESVSLPTLEEGTWQ